MSTALLTPDMPPIAIVPDTAPFNPEQRAWLNGFLAGWLGIQQTATHGKSNAHAIDLAALLRPSEEDGARVTSGSDHADSSTEEDFPWHDPSLSLDERMELAKGRSPERQLMAAMAQLDCGACGYQCQTYAEAVARGEESRLTLCAPGGRDTAKALKQLVQLHTDKSSRTTNGTSLAATTDPTTLSGNHPVAPLRKVNGSKNGSVSAKSAETMRGYHRSHPVEAQLISVHNLNGCGSRKQTSHVVCDLTQSGIDYRVGDSLGVFPTNCPALVDSVLDYVRSPESVVEGDGPRQGQSVRELLLREADLASVEDRFLELLLAHVTEDDERGYLSQLLSGELDVGDVDVLDVLIRCPSARPQAADLWATLGRLQPRLYSISSSVKAHPGQVHLTVGRVEYEKNGRLRKGVASTMFADRLRIGDRLSVFVHRSHGFTVPDDPSASLIMIGPGTGIAPFRAFLQERQATRATGRNWLFYGDQHEATDFLYRDELRDYQSTGLLTHLDTAFSRDQPIKIYVQDRMRERGQELFRWLESGAYLFVCGDAKHMARDVERALHAIIADHGRMSASDAERYVARLRSEQRYMRDVY